VNDFKSYLMDRARDPDEMPNLRSRLVVACSNIPKDIQQEMMDRDLVEPLIDNLEKTVLATVAKLEASLREMIVSYEATADSAPHRYDALRRAKQLLGDEQTS
jgi:hypothetical protein